MFRPPCLHIQSSGMNNLAKITIGPTIPSKLKSCDIVDFSFIRLFSFLARFTVLTSPELNPKKFPTFLLHHCPFTDVVKGRSLFSLQIILYKSHCSLSISTYLNIFFNISLQNGIIFLKS